MFMMMGIYIMLVSIFSLLGFSLQIIKNLVK